MIAKSDGRFALVLVTVPDLKTARLLARAALKARLIACANILPKIESHYWWQGRVQSGAEALLLLKTTRARLADLERFVLARHPYEVPEFVVLTLNGGSRPYLHWLENSVKISG